MKVAILQSSYIPWKGYFDIIGSVDTFVIYDDVQFRKNHWHNRNLIKTDHGPKWLTIPVSLPDGLGTTIEHVLMGSGFRARHWRSIEQSYARAAHWSTEGVFLEGLFRKTEGLTRLSELNFVFLEAISQRLGFGTRFCWSSQFPKGEKTGRLVEICKSLGAESYLTGPAARSYLDVAQFEAAGIAVEWADYRDYPEYPQLHGEFQHQVSIVDLLLNLGPNARAYLKTGGAGA